MRAAASLLSVALAGLAISGCSEDRIAGNTAGTENARVIKVDSVLPAWNEPAHTTTVATLRFDSTNMDFRNTDAAGRDLAVVDESDSAIPFEIVYWDKLAKLGRLRVRIGLDLLHPGARFILRWGQPLRVRSNPLAVWRAIPDSQKLALTSVLVANFENGSDTTLLPTLPVWTTGTSKDSAKDTARVTSMTFRPGGGGRAGLALSVNCRITGGGYIVVKTPLVAGGGARNIRAMDSLVFWTKGTKGKTMFTAFEHDNSFKVWKLDTLDSAWTRVRIRPSDFIPSSNPSGGNRGWEAVRDSSTDLTFIFYGGSSLWLDDVRIYGIDQEDLR
jgi:hypothetical protein